MRSEPIHPAELGGTLFVPATHPQLEAVLSGEKYPQLRSVVIDLEDGIDNHVRSEALERVQALLPSLQPASLLRFIRPHSPEMLATLLRGEGIGNIDGFVLPKFGLDNATQWLGHMQQTPHAFMPSVEGKELFSANDLQTIARLLLPFKERIPSIRFGLEDMLRQLGMVRDCSAPLHTLIAPSYVIAMVLTTFKPCGFNVSGGVYKCYGDLPGFKAELEEDLRQGLLGKTLIHPSQIAVVEEVYRVTAAEKGEAEAIVNASTNVAALHGMMLEKPTQRPWAEMILRRAVHYGVKP